MSVSRAGDRSAISSREGGGGWKTLEEPAVVLGSEPRSESGCKFAGAFSLCERIEHQVELGFGADGREERAVATLLDANRLRSSGAFARSAAVVVHRSAHLRDRTHRSLQKRWEEKER